MQTAPRTTQGHATNFRRPIARPVANRDIAMADAIVRLCRAGKTEVTNQELHEEGFTPDETRQLADRARFLAKQKMAKTQDAA